MIGANEPALENFRLLARKLASNPNYMANVLVLYQEEQGLDEERLARILGTTPEMILRLALCKRPDTSSVDSDDQIRELSDFTLIDEATLAGVLQRVDAFAERDAAVRESIGNKYRKRKPKTLMGALAAVGRLAFTTLITPRPAFVTAFVFFALLIGAIAWRELTRVPGTIPAIDDQSRSAAAPEDSPADRFATSDAPKTPPPGATSEQPAPKEISKEKNPELIARATVKLDLDETALLRDSDRAGKERIVRLGPVQTPFVLTLPRGSRRGTYNVSVVDAYGKSLISRSGSSPDGKILKTVLDMKGLHGRYRLCVSRQNEAPDYYPIFVMQGRSRPKAGKR
jgi:hypothetical protein